MYPYSDHLIDAVHGVHLALDRLESVDDVAGLTEAVNQACDKLNELNAAAGQIMRYLELLVTQAKSELGS